MNLEKLKPWNWFKHEGSQEKTLPVTRKEAGRDVDQLPALNDSPGAGSLLALHREMDRLFEQAWRSFGVPTAGGLASAPALPSASWASLDIAALDHEYEVKLDVPGLGQDDIQVEVSGDMLVIRGQKEDHAETRDKHYYRMERRSGSFQRTLALPDDVDTAEITAALKDGVLTLHLPRKALPAAETRRITIS